MVVLFKGKKEKETAPVKLVSVNMINMEMYSATMETILKLLRDLAKQSPDSNNIRHNDHTLFKR